MNDGETLRDIANSLARIEGMLSDVIGAQISGMRVFANQYRDNHKASKRRRKGSHTRAQWEALKAFYGYTCLRCGRKEPEIKLTRDHADPEGSNDISNIQPLCIGCNHDKSAAHIDYRPLYKPD